MAGPLGRKISKLCLIPQRYIMGIMAFLAIVNAYTMRVSLSIAITEMVPPGKKVIRNDSTDCEAEVGKFVPTVNKTDIVYDWSEMQQGLILSSFYWGYLVTHLPGGMLSEQFGGKYCLGLGLLSTAVSTLLTPLIVTSTGGNWTVLLAVRVLAGLGEGVTYPAINALLANWTPLAERARLGSLVYAGSQIGTIFSNLISGALITATKEWASVFYFFGGLGVLWFILWMLLCYKNPEEHPCISDHEREFLLAELDAVIHPSKKTFKRPWRHILTSVPIWAIIAAQIGHDWGFYIMVTDLPKYFKDVLKVKVSDNGLFTSLPPALMWIVSMLSGVLCDWLIVKNYMTITFSRKFFTAVAAIGPGLFIMAASYSGCNKVLAIVFFTISMGTMGSYYCGMKMNALDLSPRFAGTLMGLVNGIGAFTGILAPYAVGAIAKNRTLEEWRIVFWITFANFVITTIIYCVFGSAKEQWWSNIEEEEAEAGKRND